MLVEIATGIVLVPLFALNGLAPLLIKRIQKLPARVKFEPHDDREFLLSRGEEFHQLSSDIRRIGFEYVGSSFMKDSHSETNFSLYCNDIEKAGAMVVHMENNAQSFTYVEFSQLYANGTMLDVGNASEVSAYPKMDLKISVKYPKVRDVAELYSRFKVVRESLKNSEIVVPFDTSNGFEIVERFMAKESDILVEKGYCLPEIDSEGKRRLTLKGAYLITWRSVFPGKKIQAAIERLYSNRLLKNA